MGAPSDDDPDLTSAPQREIPVDEAWTKGTPAHNDRTSAGLVVDPATLGRLTAGIGRDRFAISSDQVRTTTGLDVEATNGANPDHERTTVDAGVAPYGRAPSEDSTVSALDQTMAELEQSDAGIEPARSNEVAEPVRADSVANHDRTKAGMGVAAAGRRAGFALLDPVRGTVPLDKQPALLQPERSPLDFVMRDMDPDAPAKAHSSGDSSRFVAAIIGDQPPPRVEVDSPATTAMEPVLRRSRVRRKWIAAGALAATAVLTALAMTLTGAEDRPKPAASEVAKVAEDQAPVAPVAANTAAQTPSEIATPTAPPDPSQLAAPTVPAGEPTVAEAPTQPPPATTQELVAVARTSETAAATKTQSSNTKPTIAKKTVATKETTDKKSSTTKKATLEKKVATKDATAKKSGSAKKASPDKKVATKDVTAKKSATKKPSTDKKKVAAKDAKAKKPSTTKKSTTDKKPTPAKKTPTKKASRSLRSSRRTRLN